MHSEIKKKVLTNILFFSTIAVVFYLSLKYALIWVLPFLFGFLIASVAESISRHLYKRVRLNRKVVSVIVVLAIFTLVSLVLVILLNKLAVTVQRYAESMPSFYNTNIVPLFEGGREFFDRILLKIPQRYRIDTTTVTSFFDDNAGEFIGNISGQAIDFLGAIIKNVPKIFVALVFTILSSIFFVIDYQNIVEFIYKQLPEKVKTVFVKIKSIMITTVFKTVKAYLLIFLITFLEISVGLVVLRVENVIGKAFLISFIDFLPFLGLAVGFIPWIFICLIKKEFYLAVGLSVVFLIVAIVRSFIEPRIVGKQIGLSPIVSLLCFYLGIKFFGVVGAFALPIVVIVLKQLNEEGTFKLWKR